MKKRILIADDEHLARIALKSMLLEIDSDFEILEVSNGVELIEKAKKFYPNIAFIDIQMPLCSGLESIEKINNDLPLVEWIILTGFAKFDYAKQAIALHVSEFLVKPVRKSKLEKTILMALSDQEKNKQRNFAEFEQKIRNFLLFARDITNNDNYFKYATLTLCSKTKKEINYFVSMIKNLICENFDIQSKGAVIYSKTILIVCESRNVNNLTYSFDNLINQIIFRKIDLMWIHCSSIFKGTKNLLSEYKNIIDNSYYWSTEKAYKPIYTPKKNKNMFELSKNLHQFCICYSEHNLFNCKENLEQIKSIIRKCDVRADINELKTFITNFNNLFNFENKTNLSTFEEVFFELNFIEGNCIHRYTSQIDSIIRYIDNHLDEDIGIKTISPLVNLSANYLSAKFKQETGIRFSEYLTRKRIGKAKFLLKASNLFVYEIAEEVGFKDIKYFSHIFQQYTGYIPSEYREKNKV